ncbi:MAG: hypothetical protein ACREF7_02165 [Candidatus Saccharimonadales bacterium]
MSEIEAELIIKRFEKWDLKQAKHDFIARMERKMLRRERNFHPYQTR